MTTRRTRSRIMCLQEGRCLSGCDWRCSRSSPGTSGEVGEGTQRTEKKDLAFASMLRMTAARCDSRMLIRNLRDLGCPDAPSATVSYPVMLLALDHLGQLQFELPCIR